VSDKIYNYIGHEYNSTRQADPLLTGRLKALLNPQYKKVYLDIGCGTGNYTIALSDDRYAFYGIDPSERMLNEARNRNSKVSWKEGTAEQIPFDDKFFDGGLATLTIHHWKNIDAAFIEINRVLKPGSVIVLFTSSPSQMNGYWLNHYFPEMMKESIFQMPEPEAVQKALESSGFEIKKTEKYFIQPDLKDHFLYAGKHDPKMYFNENIRRGISSFTALAKSLEVKNGLERLYSDFKSGIWNGIKEKYENDLGDYLFIVAEKT
jgi:SAM-dependent methyltransferase